MYLKEKKIIKNEHTNFAMKINNEYSVIIW